MANRPDGPSGVKFWALLGVLGVLQSCWLAWILVEPLPNARNVGGTVRRGILLMRAVPEVVPGVRWRESHLGMLARELSHVEYLPQRLPIVFAAGFLFAAALAMGELALRAIGLMGRLSVYERTPVAFGLGVSAMGLATLLLGRLGWLAPWPIRIGLVLLILLGLLARLRCPRAAHHRDSNRRFTFPSRLFTFTLITGPFLLLMALGAMLPSVEFDSLEYHLQAPKEYFLAGRITFLPHNVYASMPFGVEMLHLLAMIVAGDWFRGALVGQVLVMLFAPMAAWLIALTATSLGSPRAGWFAAVIYLTTPWVYRLAVLPFVEGPLCYFHAALIWGTHAAWAAARAGVPAAGTVAHVPDKSSSVPTNYWFLVGAFAGAAMACKYPAMITAVIPFAAVALLAALKRASPAIFFAYVAGTALVAGPWLAKNVVDHRNPVYPLGWRVFGGTPWSTEREQKWSSAHKPLGISRAALITDVLEVAGRSDWQSPIYTALVPLAFLRRGSRRSALALCTYGAYVFFTWWLLTHRVDRFWVPLFPGLAVLSGLGADWSRRWGWSVLLGGIMSCVILTNLAYISTALAGLNQWTDDLESLRVEVPRFVNAALAKLDADLPPGAKVMLVGQASVFHLRRPVVYNTVFDDEIFETVSHGRSPAEVHRALKDLGILYVYVDWFEIERHRKPGGYGFTPYVTAARFDDLVRAGVLEPLPSPEPHNSLYRVR